MDQASELECRHHIDRLMIKFFHGHKDGSATELSEADYVNTPHVMVSCVHLFQISDNVLIACLD